MPCRIRRKLCPYGQRSYAAGRLSLQNIPCDHVRRHPCVLESGAEEGSSDFRVAMLPEEHLDDLPLLVDGAVDVAPVPGHFHVLFIDRPVLTHAAMLPQSSAGNSTIAGSRMQKGRTPFLATKPIQGLGRASFAITRRI